MANNSIGAYTLRVTPEEVQACAAELYGKVNAVRGIFEEIDSRISATANYWESDAADKYRAEYKGSEKKVTAMLSAMSEHAKALDLSARIHEDRKNKCQRSGGNFARQRDRVR